MSHSCVIYVSAQASCSVMTLTKQDVNKHYVYDYITFH